MMRNLEKLEVDVPGVVEYNSGELERCARAAAPSALAFAIVAAVWAVLSTILLDYADSAPMLWALPAAFAIVVLFFAGLFVGMTRWVLPKLAKLQDAWLRRTVVMDAFDLFCRLEQLGRCDELTPLWGVEADIVFDRVLSGEKAFTALIFRKRRLTIWLEASATCFKWRQEITQGEIVEALVGLERQERILRSQDEELSRRHSMALWPAMRSLRPNNKTVAQEATAPTASHGAPNAPSGASNTN